MPMPVSVTSMRSVSRPASTTPVASRTMWPSCVNLMALPTRFMTIWRRRPGSPRTMTGTSMPTLTIISMPRTADCRDVAATVS
jgi:hypothetical protein